MPYRNFISRSPGARGRARPRATGIRFFSSGSSSLSASGPVSKWCGLRRAPPCRTRAILRWYSIGYLGRYFTVDVSISAEHRLIDSGPYRFIRHPTYTGALLAFLGLGFCLGNWLSILFLSLPIIAVFLRRVRIEERALLGALGEQYRPYMRRTKRLVPFIY